MAATAAASPVVGRRGSAERSSTPAYSRSSAAPRPPIRRSAATAVPTSTATIRRAAAAWVAMAAVASQEAAGPNGGAAEAAAAGFGGGGGANGGGAGGFGGGGGGAYANSCSTAAPGAGGFGAGSASTDPFNAAGGGGGGSAARFLTLAARSAWRARISGNTAQRGAAGGFGAVGGLGLGGGVFNRNGAVSITSSTFSGNAAAHGGGGIYNLGDGQAPGIATVVVLTLLFRRYERDVWRDVSLGLLLAGVLGNLTHRLLHGAVIDFLLFNLHVPFADPWPPSMSPTPASASRSVSSWCIHFVRRKQQPLPSVRRRFSRRSGRGELRRV